MRLEKFRVTNFRSVKDSGWIDVSGRTALVGGNESGKTNLLLALRSLEGRELSVNRDFPADRLRSDLSDDLDVVQSVWALSQPERDELAEIFPRAKSATHVEVGRGFGFERWVRFNEIANADIPADEAKRLFERLTSAAHEDGNLSEPPQSEALDALGAALLKDAADLRSWATGVTEALTGLSEPIQMTGVALSDDARSALEEIADLAATTTNSSEYENAAHQWILRALPSFVFLDEYPEIQGEQNLAEFALRQREEQPEPGDEYFEMLLSVAGIDPKGLDELLQADPETRRQLTSRAGAVLTRTLRELWSDRALKVRFNLDGDQFNTLVADPTSLYDVEVNLNERSRGFRWFFSFCIMFAAKAAKGEPEQNFLLLDEPGLHLHAVGQRDLLAHLAELPHQVLFSTQSPFMVPAGDVGNVRTVTFTEDAGTTVSNRPAGDHRAMLPVLYALGSEVAAGLFADEPELVVPEITDYWYLRLASQFLSDQGKPAMPQGITVVPAGGASRLPYLLALLGEPRAQTLVMLPEDMGSGGLQGELLGAHLAEHDNLVFIPQALSGAREGGADIEDLLDAESYDRFVRFAYRKVLKDRELEPDSGVPRIVRRYEKAFEAIGIEFSRSRPARLMLRGAAQNPKPIFPDLSAQNFERLFEMIRARFEAVTSPR